MSQPPILTPAGDAARYLIGILHFDSLAAIREAFASDVGRECAADRRILAPNDEDVQMYLFDTIEV